MANISFTTIQDWMLDLDLDVYETIVYAVIVGFCMDGESTFKGSWSYLCRKAMCSRRKIAQVLPSLEDKGLIRKIDKEIRGVKLCEYVAVVPDINVTENARVVHDVHGVVHEMHGGSACGAPNNIEDNIKENIDRKDKENTTLKSSTKETEKTRFIKPSLEEVQAYCKERGNNVDAERFIDHYESNGWMVGRTHMKDWKATVRNWEREKRTISRPATHGKLSNDTAYMAPNKWRNEY